jgi:hypothetical protein
MTWAPKDQNERDAVVLIAHKALHRGRAEHQDASAIVQEVVPPVPSRTREYPRVVRWEPARFGFSIVVTFEDGEFRTYSAASPNGRVSPPERTVAQFARNRPDLDDDTIAELLALKANPTEAVTLPDDAPRVAISGGRTMRYAPDTNEPWTMVCAEGCAHTRARLSDHARLTDDDLVACLALRRAEA